MTTATTDRPKNERAVALRPEQAALQALDAELERRQSVVEASAASLIDPKRLKAVVLSQFTRNPDLWECDVISVARSVVEAAQMGLEPTGAIGGAHLVPFRNSKTGKKEAQLIIDYRGYVQLARRSGEVSKVWARVVRERDEFYVDAGTEDTLHHRPYLGTEDPGNVTHVYAVIAYRDGSQQFDYDTRAWVETIRKRSKASDRGPWVTDWAEMAKKSILRRLLKTAPLTVEARRAIELEEQDEAEAAQQRSGRQSANVRAIHDRLGISNGDERTEATPGGSEDAPIPESPTPNKAQPAGDAPKGQERAAADVGGEGADDEEAAGVDSPAPAADLVSAAHEAFGEDIEEGSYTPVEAGEHDASVQAGMDLLNQKGGR